MVGNRRRAPSTRNQAEGWLGQLGVEMVDVHFMLRDSTWKVEAQVDDKSVLEEVIRNRLSQMNARAAVAPCEDQWVLLRLGQEPRFCPSFTSAQMIAIHDAR